MHGKLSGPIPYYSLGFLQRIYIQSIEFCQTSSDLYVYIPNKDVSVFHTCKCTCTPVSLCRSKYLFLVLQCMFHGMKYRTFHIEATHPKTIQDTVVPTNAYVRMAPMFLKKNRWKISNIIACKYIKYKQ